MSKFLIQNDKNSMEEEKIFILQQFLHQNIHTYDMIGINDIDNYNEKGLFPIGTINFVEKYVKIAYGVAHENPIEIPKYLRTDEFLKRDYYFTDWNGIPRHGKFFLKDVSRLKYFGEVVIADYFIDDNLFNYVRTSEFDSTLVLSKDHKYLVSSLYNIVSEYRIYVFNNVIESIVCYNGDCTVFPDINLIKKAVCLIEYNEKWLKSYTIDVMTGNKGTAIIEIHNFTSVGLYSTLWGSGLLYAYKDGINYIINDNKEVEV